MRIPAYIKTSVEEWLEGFKFSGEIKVRFSETDGFGHLNNTNAFVYFEEVRTDFFKHLGFMQKWTSLEYEAMIVVADLQCDYIKQVHFDERLTVSVKVNDIGRSSLDLHYVALNAQNDICLIGRGTVVQINKETGLSLAWDDDFKMLFKQA
ncbi:acyl-CoA thioesterase [Halalkalibacter krulwichiae]|uniref:Acyl-CoA thioesterase YbgC n=1 Tax=Halalkalibacter krulwichiae TaxID=199441 RepID=A0A1X9MDX2_9BACI|nr:thioesterase family protein [Halalkalibacter krulwichiae]ARK31649.1 acyl-CoA thioesterase YbgC [Halalkalibacter krulwichiae]